MPWIRGSPLIMVAREYDVGKGEGLHEHTIVIVVRMSSIPTVFSIFALTHTRIGKVIQVSTKNSIITALTLPERLSETAIFAVSTVHGTICARNIWQIPNVQPRDWLSNLDKRKCTFGWREPNSQNGTRTGEKYSRTLNLCTYTSGLLRIMYFMVDQVQIRRTDGLFPAWW